MRGLDGDGPDVLIVGGGIHGAWAALEATLRGLRTALVERDDFGSGTSANSLKIVHGGFRHLASARPDRVRRSARELASLMNFAPELLVPLPCMLRTRRRPGRGRPSLWVALKAYQAITAGIERGRAEDGEHLICSREVVELCPALGGGAHTGGAVWHDGQLLDSERLVLAVLAVAAEEGAAVANYAEASTFVVRGGRVVEVEVRDRLEGGSTAVRPRLVYNATNLPSASVGAWEGDRYRAESDGSRSLATGFNAIVDREVSEVGVGVESSASGAVSLSGSTDPRMFFLAPWQGRTLVGTGYLPAGGPGPSAVGEEEVSALLSAFNAAAPSLDLSLDEVTHLHVGNLPAEESRNGLRLAGGREESSMGARDVENLVGVVAPKYTTARLSAVRGVDECERRLGRSVSDEATARIGPCRLRQAELGPGPDDELTREVVTRAVSEEMAGRLGDLVMRRTNMGAAGPPSWKALERAASMMADELGWDREERRSEISALLDEYHPLVRPDPPSGAPRGGGAGVRGPNRRGRSS